MVGRGPGRNGREREDASRGVGSEVSDTQAAVVLEILFQVLAVSIIGIRI